MTLRWAAVVAVMAALAACGGNKDAAAPAATAPSAAAPTATPPTDTPAAGAMKAYTADVTKIADAVATVKDEVSAKAAAGVIASTNTELSQLITQIDAMSDTDKASAAMANMQELVAAQQKIAIAMSNMAMNNPGQMKILADELGKMPELKTN